MYILLFSCKNSRGVEGKISPYPALATTPNFFYSHSSEQSLVNPISNSDTKESALLPTLLMTSETLRSKLSNVEPADVCFSGNGDAKHPREHAPFC